MVKQQFDRAQDIANQSEISEKRRMIRDAQGEFQNRMISKEFLPSEWGPAWIEELKGIEGAVGLNEKDMNPIVRRTLHEDFENFASSSLIEISGSALKENLRRGKQNLQRDDAYYKGIGDHAARKELVNETTVLTEEEKKDFNRTIDQEALSDDILLSRVTNAQEHLIAVTGGAYPHMSDLQRQNEIDATQRVIDNQENVAIDEILDQAQFGAYLDDKDSTREEKIAAALAADPAIRSKSAKKIAAGLKSTAVLSDQEMQGFQRRIDALSDLENNPREYSKAWQGIAVDIAAGRQRGGMGGYSSALNLVHPSRFSAEKNKEREDAIAAGTAQKKLETIEKFARKEVDAFATGSAEVQYTEESDKTLAGTTAAKKAQSISNSKIKFDIERTASLVQGLIQDEVDELLAQPGVHTREEVQKLIKDIGPQISAQVTMGQIGINAPKDIPKTLAAQAADFPPVAPSEVTKPPRVRSNRGLDTGLKVEDTLLPGNTE